MKKKKQLLVIRTIHVYNGQGITFENINKVNILFFYNIFRFWNPALLNKFSVDFLIIPIGIIEWLCIV